MSIDTRTIIGNAIRSVAFEGLESRQLLAGVQFAGGTLSINGTGRSDEILISLSKSGDVITAKLNDYKSQIFAADQVWMIDINALDGNNRVWVDPRITATTVVDSGVGDDTITTGAGNDGIRSGYGKDIIDTGSGNDMVDAGAGNDRVAVGDGNDFVTSGSGNDTIDAGNGSDQVYARRGDDKLTGDVTDTLDPGVGRDRISRRPSVNPSGISAPSVKKLSLVNADTGVAIAGYDNLWTGITLDLAKLPKHLSIVAHVDGGESVKFALSDGSINRIENSDLFSLTQKVGGGLTSWSPAKGKVTLDVTPYSKDDGQGLSGTTYSIQLTFVDSTTVPTPNPTPDPTPTPTTDANAPQINLDVLQSTVIAGQGYHVHAARTVVPNYQIEDAKFEWDFGDAFGSYNKLNGFNAAHIYNTPGRYTVTLTVTAPGGKVSVATTTVNVVASNYKAIYVSAWGNDNASGASESSAVRTVDRALQLAGDNTMILFKRGETHTISQQQTVGKNNLVLSTYGQGSSPIILWTGSRAGINAMFYIPKGTTNVAIRGLTFNTIFNTDTEQNIPHAIHNGGTNVTIEGNNFLNVGYAINNNLQPTGVYIADNKAPLDTGIRGYFSWTQGTDFVIVGNEVANSTREHVVRVGGAERLVIANNKFTNLDRTAKGDYGDAAKGAITNQKGAYSYISNNTLGGPAAIGPLGGNDGLNDKGARFNHAVFEGNTMLDSTLFVVHGANNVTIRDNTFNSTNRFAIDIQAYNAQYNRWSTDVTVDHNVAFNTGTTGGFLYVGGGTPGITLTNNVLVASNLQPGSYGTAAVYVNENDLSNFRKISGNVWPSTSRAGSYARGSMTFMGTTYNTQNHRPPSEWNSLPQVGDDKFEDVSSSNAWKITNSNLKLAA